MALDWRERALYRLGWAVGLACGVLFAGTAVEDLFGPAYLLAAVIVAAVIVFGGLTSVVVLWATHDL